LNAGTQTLNATFTPTDTVHYSVTTAKVSLVVHKATPVLHWTPAVLPIGSKLTAAQLDATANVAGKFVYTPGLGSTISTSIETLKVVFTPTSTTNYNSATDSVQLPLNTVRLAPSSIDFGTVYLGTITKKNITVTNLGSSAATISAPLVSVVKNGDSREFLAANLCPKSLAAHASCTIQISFIAGPFYHQQSATLNVGDSSPGSPQPVSLTALTIDPVATLSASSLSFGTKKVGVSSAAKSVTLSNTGATALTITGIVLTGTNAADFLLVNPCGSSLAAGAHCSIGVTFKPKAKGSRSASITIKDNAQNSPQSIKLAGIGD
jgi:Abnormal spindle-like microcephaly-assoc'd, ASPM-SPD-2-Hydin